MKNSAMNSACVIEQQKASVRVLPCRRHASSSCWARSIGLDCACQGLRIEAPVSPREMSEVHDVALSPVLEAAELASQDALDETALEDEVVSAQRQEVGSVHALAAWR